MKNKIYFTHLREAFDKYNNYRKEKGLPEIKIARYHKYALRHGYGTWETFINLIDHGLYEHIINHEKKLENKKEYKKERRQKAREIRRVKREEKEQQTLEKTILINETKESEEKILIPGKTRLEEGFLYIIQNPIYPGWVKIGSTIDLNRRLQSYQTCDPFQSFEIVYSEYCTNRKDVEIKVHNMLAKHRGNGEWFKIDLKKAIKKIKSFRNEQLTELEQ